MKQIRTTIESPYEPNDNGALWLDTSNPDAPILKAFTNGKWQATIGGEKVTEIDSDSTDEEIPTAKAVNDRITALADIVRPIKMLALPTTGDSLEDIFGSGMTLSEIKAAAEGKRNAVVYQQGSSLSCFPISEAKYDDEYNWRIEFCILEHTSAGVVDSAWGRAYRCENGDLYIIDIEV